MLTAFLFTIISVFAPDTTKCYYIDSEKVDAAVFDGSQLVGQKIVSYTVDTVKYPEDKVFIIHDILTESGQKKTDKLGGHIVNSQNEEPLYIIDGVVVSSEKVKKMDIQDVESMSVIQGDKAVGQYGQAAKYGVLIVLTKKAAGRRVNIGYGEADRRDVSYSVASVKPSETEVYTNMYDYLRGKVAGVEIGPGNSIIIRGVSTLNGSTDPLIFLDGTEVSSLDAVNPQDVYSVDILKDASAAIYGVRGANGVILITTKAGQAAKQQEAAKAKRRTK